MKVTVTAVGIAGRDPELKFAKSGKPWAKFPIAVTERIKENDEWVDGNTTWYDIYSWGSTAESAAEYVEKGKRVIVHGTLKRNDWENDEGVTKTTLEIAADTVGLAPFPPRGGGSRSKGSSKPRSVPRTDVAEPPF